MSYTLANPGPSAPVRLTQGDTTAWTVSFADFPASDGWGLAYHYTRPDGSVQVAVTASADGDGFLVSIDAAKAAEFTALGEYLFRAVASLAGEVHTVARGRLEVLDPLTGATDRRLWLEKVVAALEARAENRATAQQLSYSVEGRSLSLMSLAEVLDVRDRLRAELDAARRAEDVLNGNPTSRAVRVRLWE